VIEIPGKDHIVTFDGRVIEAFETSGGSTRIHIWMVSEIEITFATIIGECVLIKYGVGGASRILVPFEEHYRPQFEQFLSRVQAARGAATAG
jgi:hypothetical protein